MSGYVRLLMTTDAIGGVWQYSLDLCRHLTRRRVEVILAVLGPAPDAYQRRTAGAIGGVSLVEIEGELDWLAPDAASLADSAGRLCRLAREQGVGLVHLNAPALNACVDFPVPVVAVSHSCLGTWWDAVRSGPLPPEFAWRNALHAKGLRRAQIVVCPSRSFAESTAMCHQLERTPRIVLNGRSPLPLPRGAMHDFALTAGRLWDVGKDVATLDRAAAHLGIPFRAAGRTRGENGEQQHFANLSLLGQLDEAGLARMLAARPVFASAALYEPFGLAVLEAATAGCPLVLSDIPTYRELWDDVATFVPPGDDRGFARAIDTLIGDARRRIERGEAARRRARQYSTRAMGYSMIDLYARLLRDPASPRARAAA